MSKKIFEVELSKQIKKHLSLMIMADSEEEIEQSIEKIKKELNKRYDDFWWEDHEFGGSETIEIYFVNEMEDLEECDAEIVLDNLV